MIFLSSLHKIIFLVKLGIKPLESSHKCDILRNSHIILDNKLLKIIPESSQN